MNERYEELFEMIYEIYADLEEGAMDEMEQDGITFKWDNGLVAIINGKEMRNMTHDLDDFIGKIAFMMLAMK